MGVRTLFPNGPDSRIQPAFSFLTIRRFSATTATFAAGNFGLSCHRANSLLAKFEHASIGTVEAAAAVTAKVQRPSTVTAYRKLVKRCRQLGAG